MQVQLFTKHSFLAILFLMGRTITCAQTDSITVDWNEIIAVSKTTATLQLVENPMVRPGSPIHEPVFKALKNLNTKYVRYVPWFPYPKMAVAELKPPTKSQTSWDFTWLDSTMNKLMTSTNEPVINFSTIPAWMWVTDSAVKYPDNAYQIDWNYNQGKQLKDTTCKQVADYFARVFNWYTKGGFTDELGRFHKSGHHYKIKYWEILNEPDLEHTISPQLYTKMYDAIVHEIKKISPVTKFIGLSLSGTNNPEYFEYFLNPGNHIENTPPDGISYHHYSFPSWNQHNAKEWQHSLFEKADAFLYKVRYIENIRKRLSPGTFTHINEIGAILSPPSKEIIIDPDYWPLAGAMFAYMYIELTKLGIEVAGASQLVGYPGQFPDVSMVDWNNGEPNARYHVLKLLSDNFGPGDQLLKTQIHGNYSFTDPPPFTAQAFITSEGKKILLINKSHQQITVKTGTKEISLQPFEVQVVVW